MIINMARLAVALPLLLYSPALQATAATDLFSKRLSFWFAGIEYGSREGFSLTIGERAPNHMFIDDVKVERCLNSGEKVAITPGKTYMFTHGRGRYQTFSTGSAPLECRNATDGYGAVDCLIMIHGERTIRFAPEFETRYFIDTNLCVFVEGGCESFKMPDFGKAAGTSPKSTFGRQNAAMSTALSFVDIAKDELLAAESHCKWQNHARRSIYGMEIFRYGGTATEHEDEMAEAVNRARLDYLRAGGKNMPRIHIDKVAVLQDRIICGICISSSTGMRNYFKFDSEGRLRLAMAFSPDGSETIVRYRADGTPGVFHYKRQGAPSNPIVLDNSMSGLERKGDADTFRANALKELPWMDAIGSFLRDKAEGE